MRFHLFPFRTEKLSSLTPMVLRFSRGRVGSRLFKPILFRVGFFVFDSQPYKDISSIGRGVGLKRRLCRNSCVNYPPNPLSVKGAYSLCKPIGLLLFFLCIAEHLLTRFTQKTRDSTSRRALVFAFRYAQNPTPLYAKIKRSTFSLM